MTFTDHIVRDVGGTIETDLLEYSAAVTAVTITIYDGVGSARLAATAATIASLSTTLAADAHPGDRSLELAALVAADLSAGQRFKVAPTDRPAQVFTARIVDATADRVWTYEAVAELLPYASPVRAVRASYTVASTVATSTWWNGEAVWTPTVAGAAQGALGEVLHCTLRRLPITIASESDLEWLLGDRRRFIDDERDALARQLWLARQRLLQDMVAAGVPAHVILGPRTLLARAHAIRWALDAEHRWGPTALDWDAMRARYRDELDTARQLAVRDVDQDRMQLPTEQGPYAVEMIRG